MNVIPKILDSGIDMTDCFCGAGGSSTGAVQSGVRVRMAINHWDLAVETHNTNHPTTDHDCRDIQACDPRRYPSTRIGWFSPECTNHLLAKGKKRTGQAQGGLFGSAMPDPSEERSRATMWDVVRFTEYHCYDVVLVENVVDAARWALWPAWLKAMHDMGYRHRVVYMNSMFCHPTPQSRDRLYVCFWRKGVPEPDLDVRPRAWCSKCEADVEGVQAWRDTPLGRQRWGKYGQQYDYVCPRCAFIVQPYYYAALNAIDLSLPAERIGDRARPLKDRTMERIRYGLEKYGNQYLVVTTRYTSGVDCRVRPAASEEFPTQPGDLTHALVSPFLVETGFSHAPGFRARGGSEPMSAQTGRASLGVCLPMIVTAGSRESAPVPSLEPIPTQTGSERFGTVIPPAWVVPLRMHGLARGLDREIQTVVAGANHHMLVINGGALLTMRDSQGSGYLLRGLDAPISTQMASATQDFLLQRAPFLTPYYGASEAGGSGEAMPTVTTVDRCGVVTPTDELRAEDCYFRMLQPHEIKAAMAFPGDYTILGKKRDQVKQLGNAVTPPCARLLVERCVRSLS